MTQPPAIAPGWYPAPDAPNRERWWDGYRWGILRPPHNALASTAFTVCIVSLALNFIPYFIYFGVALAGAGVIIGIIAAAMKPPRTLAFVGIGLAVVGIVLGVLITGWVRSL